MQCAEPNHRNCYMKEHCLKYSTCPMVLVQDVLEGKWKILILWHLNYRVLRFTEIKNLLPNVTQKMLTQQLRSLEDSNLIIRHVYPVVPPKVEYSLTELGQKIIPILELMHGFGAFYLEQSPNKVRN